MVQSQVDVRNITSKISDLNEKLDMSATLVEPRENAFMAFEWRHNTAPADISAALAQFGKVSASIVFTRWRLCVVSVPYLIPYSWRSSGDTTPPQLTSAPHWHSSARLVQPSYSQGGASV